MASPSIVDLSVEITTFNRKDTLCEALRALARQTLDGARFEVVLSDDGSTDGLQSAVAALATDLPYALRLVQNAHRGPGHAHNCGIEACRGELVVMLAADIIAAPTLVSEHLRSHREHPAPEVMIVGGLTQSPALPGSAFQRAADHAVERVFRNQFANVEHGGFLVSNLSFKKSFMCAHGMFREWPPAAGEDIELGFRLRTAGMRLLDNPAALGYHHHEESMASVARRAYTAGYNSHHYVEAIDTTWVRRRFGKTAESAGVGERALVGVRSALRQLLVNRISNALLVEPLLRGAERLPALEALTPFLFDRFNAYYFNRGLIDQRRGRPCRLPVFAD
ncbi:MAG: glycosyltransferase family 2 protein [Acidobacteria bacterium]|nr:glycosyltransferase family 2 protein [Acidobacteriota bacterium]